MAKIHETLYLGVNVSFLEGLFVFYEMGRADAMASEGGKHVNNYPYLTDPPDPAKERAEYSMYQLGRESYKARYMG